MQFPLSTPENGAKFIVCTPWKIYVDLAINIIFTKHAQVKLGVDSHLVLEQH